MLGVGVNSNTRQRAGVRPHRKCFIDHLLCQLQWKESIVDNAQSQRLLKYDML